MTPSCFDALFAGGPDPIEALEEDLARLGARVIIRTTVEAEVEALLGRPRAQRAAGAGPDVPVMQAGHRNGYGPVTVKTTAGRSPSQRPKLCGTTENDGARHQLDLIDAETVRRGLTVPVLLHFVHVAEYVRAAGPRLA